MRVDTNYDGEADAWGDNYGILRGDFGTSFKFRGSNPLTLIGERLGATIELNIAVLLVGLILAESALSFIGFGIQAPTPTWAICSTTRWIICGARPI